MTLGQLQDPALLTALGRAQLDRSTTPAGKRLDERRVPGGIPPDELALDEANDARLWDYLVMAAHSLVNQQSGTAARGPDLGLSPA